MPDQPYDIGYKKPPKEHRFKKGKSGNPKGRPKGARSLQEEVRRALRKPIPVTEDGKQRKISVLEAALRRLVQQAVGKGDMRAINQVLMLAESYGLEVANPSLPSNDGALVLAAMRRLIDEEEAR